MASLLVSLEKRVPSKDRTRPSLPARQVVANRWEGLTFRSFMQGVEEYYRTGSELGSDRMGNSGLRSFGLVACFASLFFWLIHVLFQGVLLFFPASPVYVSFLPSFVDISLRFSSLFAACLIVSACSLFVCGFLSRTC